MSNFSSGYEQNHCKKLFTDERCDLKLILFSFLLISFLA